MDKLAVIIEYWDYLKIDSILTVRVAPAGVLTYRSKLKVQPNVCIRLCAYVTSSNVKQWNVATTVKIQLDPNHQIYQNQAKIAWSMLRTERTHTNTPHASLERFQYVLCIIGHAVNYTTFLMFANQQTCHNELSCKTANSHIPPYIYFKICPVGNYQPEK